MTRATGWAVSAERAALEILDGSCRTPIGGLATIDGRTLHLQVLLASLDGKQVWRTQRSGAVDDAVALGHDAGARIARQSRGWLLRRSRARIAPCEFS